MMATSPGENPGSRGVVLVGDGAGDCLGGPEGDIVRKILSDEKALCSASVSGVISVLVGH